MNQKIQIVISPTGVATIRTLGFQGAECKAATRSLEQALGLSSLDTPTTEYYQTSDASNSQSLSR